jgi:type VI secretion system Hcp family effector
MREGTVSTSSSWMAYMHVKGSSQGVFQEDGSRAGKDKTLCRSVRFRGEVPHDVRNGKYAVTKHEPISVIHELCPATVQFVSALWSNEVLDEVVFEFVREDAAGKEQVYATLTLNKVTVAYAELRPGDQALAEGEHRPLADVGVHAEKMELKMKTASGQVTATYDRKQAS